MLRCVIEIANVCAVDYVVHDRFFLFTNETK